MPTKYYEVLEHDIGIALHQDGRAEVVPGDVLVDAMLGRLAPEGVYAGVIGWATARKVWPELKEYGIDNE